MLLSTPTSISGRYLSRYGGGDEHWSLKGCHRVGLVTQSTRDCWRLVASSSLDSYNNRRSARDGSNLRDNGRVYDRTAAILSDERFVSFTEEDVSPEDTQSSIARLILELRAIATYSKRVEYLMGRERVQRCLKTTSRREQILLCMSSMSSRRAFCILCLMEIGQEHVMFALSDEMDPNEYMKSLNRLAESLERVEEFYDSIGGLAGYQLQCLALLSSEEAASESDLEERHVEMLVPEGLDLRSEESNESVLKGVEMMGRMAEIYPLGGAGDRLGLQCEETGDSLPTAVLPYCGRSLLENLIRDIQGREYLYYCLYGEQSTTPVAVMTSLAKGNHKRVMQLFEANHWFGRGEESFKLFKQPMVPIVKAIDGKWAVSGPLKIIMKPGGHGVIWKLMLDNGVFDWLKSHNRDAAIVRQISNPMAGQDKTLLALAGQGIVGNKAFGFASCERVVGAAEGMNVVLKETLTKCDGSKETTSRITNVEYTEFTRLGIEDKGENGSSYSLFPANTNVLYLGLEHIEKMVRQGVRSGTTEAVLPGMILNTSKEICHLNVETEQEEHAHAGRLECTMQNLADCFAAPVNQDTNCSDLPTFLVYGPRRKVTSSAKRKRKPGSLKIHQTPDGSFYDLQQNAKAMLELCGMDMPDVGSVEKYLETGPGFVFLFHPALGPLWHVVAQKIKGGKMHERAEVQLEVAEASIVDLEVSGSLIVSADSVMGTHVDGRLHYSRTTCARICLENVKVDNQGIDYENPHNVYWRHRVERKESCQIVLKGRSEFEARNVTLKGNLKYIVPDGHRMIVSPGGSDVNMPQVDLVPLHPSEPTWSYAYTIDNGISLNKI